jgi:hypothetical protein
LKRGNECADLSNFALNKEMRGSINSPIILYTQPQNYHRRTRTIGNYALADILIKIHSQGHAQKGLAQIDASGSLWRP